MHKIKMVCGVGINDYSNNVKISGKHMHSYIKWHSMLVRCYDVKSKVTRPTYDICTVCDEWLSFTNFKKWYDENYVDGFALDKDILVEGNKVYSPDTCRFVPQYLNNLLNNHARRSSAICQGVTELKPNDSNTRVRSSYMAQCSDGNGRQLNKTFKTVEEAHEWYVATKKLIVKNQAQRAFLENSIKTDIYMALLSRKF